MVTLLRVVSAGYDTRVLPVAVADAVAVVVERTGAEAV